jgi:hypothetical protein
VFDVSSSADGSAIIITGFADQETFVARFSTPVRVPEQLSDLSGAASRLAVDCDVSTPRVGQMVSCTVSGGVPGVEIFWRAAYNPPFAGQGVTLDTDGSGTFAFTVPAVALGQELTLELVDWLAPVSLGVVGGPVPTSVPSGGGPVPVWSLVMLALALALAGGLVLRRMSTVSVRG